MDIEEIDNIKAAVGYPAESSRISAMEEKKRLLEELLPLRNRLLFHISNKGYSGKENTAVGQIDKALSNHFEDKVRSAIDKGSVRGSPAYKMLYHSLISSGILHESLSTVSISLYEEITSCEAAKKDLSRYIKLSYLYYWNLYEFNRDLLRRD